MGGDGDFSCTVRSALHRYAPEYADTKQDDQKAGYTI